MPTNEHLVLCSGADAKPRGDEKLLTLNLHGASANVRLEIISAGAYWPIFLMSMLTCWK